MTTAAGTRSSARTCAAARGARIPSRISPQGYYCVHPDFVFGNILTIQNTDTGKTLRCTVADAVAPWDQPFWRSHFAIEISYSLFTDLGLTNGNHVRVWAMNP